VAVEVADRVAVMYGGRIVETGPVAALLHDARHPYTRGLLASRVERVARGERLETIPGSPPDLAALPPGCAFAPRCSRATTACQSEPPDLIDDGQGRAVACFNATIPAE
jgi:peptide/nickel transport system ATP-binding protein